MQRTLLAINRKMLMLIVLLSMGRLPFVYIFLMGHATEAVNVYFLTHVKLRDHCANSSCRCRYLVSSDFDFIVSLLSV